MRFQSSTTLLVLTPAFSPLLVSAASYTCKDGPATCFDPINKYITTSCPQATNGAVFDKCECDVFSKMSRQLSQSCGVANVVASVTGGGSVTSAVASASASSIASVKTSTGAVVGGPSTGSQAATATSASSSTNGGIGGRVVGFTWVLPFAAVLGSGVGVFALWL
ncbi:hypothetical protein EJ08DRAFT_657355 [Tothia fuscella]|uniref:Extracellular membrane protein CFEM domain-containing protein n=1 Tax=Tothia fuscella TaxID=1048955 RepID=A0A9P4U359_9PEZI|nr:hypothetical protein EJ08DRAFT_657355 [Tothia fuscella]